jgi:hypothetical protein
MGDVFAYHFTRNGNDIALAGGGIDEFGGMNAKERLDKILENNLIKGGNRKGYFHKQQEMPLSVSFSGIDLGNIGTLLNNGFSQYGLAVSRKRVKDLLNPVKYLNDEQIWNREFYNEDKWLVDLVRPEGYFVDEFDEEGYPTGDGFWKKAYDFSWQKEERIKGPGLELNGGPDFVFVPNGDEVKRIQGERGLEAFDLDYHFDRFRRFLKEHGKGKIKGLENKFRDVWNGVVSKGGISAPKEGKFLMREVLDGVWDEVGKIVDE